LYKVKKYIESEVKQGAYAIHSKNDILNTYRIGKLSGLESINMNITLNVLENSSTNIHFVVTEIVRYYGQCFRSRNANYVHHKIKMKNEKNNYRISYYPITSINKL